jgi:hypothetical protein
MRNGIEHTQIHLMVGDYADEVDAGLVPILRPLWEADIETISSCQNAGENLAHLENSCPHLADQIVSLQGVACIDFVPPAVIPFFELVAAADPTDEMYERMTYWRAPGAWKTTTTVLSFTSGKFGIYGMKVSFPQSDISEIGACLERSLSSSAS